jgi:DNA polymerase-3 subunit delta
MSYIDFGKDLKSGEFKPVYVFYGHERYVLDIMLKKTVEKIIDPSYESLNYQIFDGEKSPLSDIIDSFEVLPFMGEKRLVVVKNATILESKKSGHSDDEMKRLVEYVKNPAISSVVILVAGEKIDGKKSVNKTLKSQKAQIEFSKISTVDLEKTLQKKFAENGKRIDKIGIRYLIDMLGYVERGSSKTLYEVFNQVDVLIASTGQIEDITRDHINAVISKPLEKSIFDMIDAITNKKPGDAIKILQKIRSDGEDDLRTVGMIYKHYRNLIKVNELMERGYSASVIAQKLGMKEYPVKKCCSQAGFYDHKKLSEIVIKFSEYDRKIKRGQIPKNLALEEMIVMVAMKK